MRGVLDDYFALSMEGKVHCLDMHKLIEKLEVCSKTNNRQYIPLSYPFYQQDPQIRLVNESSRVSSGGGPTRPGGL